MFCPNCGTNNENDAVFCANCGTPLTAEQPQVNPVQNAQQPQVNVEQPQANATQGQFGGQPQVDATQGQFNNQQFVGQGQQFNSQSQFGAQAEQKPKKEFKLPFDKKKLPLIGGIAAAVLVVIIGLIVFINIGKKNGNYKKIAMNYVKAVEQCDWDTAYGLINLPDGEFLTKDAFTIAHKDSTGAQVVNISATDAFATVLVPGSKKVDVAYSTPTSSYNTETLTLEVSPKKRMLFFKQYKVSSESVLSKDSQIRVPKGLKLYLNDVEVAEGYKDSNSSSSSYDTYKIPYLFEGTLKIKVTGDMVEDYETEKSIYGDENSYSVSSSSLKIKSDATNAVKSQAESDLKAFATAALGNKDYSNVNSLAHSSYKDSMKTYYTNNFVSYLHSSSREFSEFSLNNITTKISSDGYNVDSSDGNVYIKVSVSYKMTGKYTYKSSYSSSTEATARNASGSDSGYITYKYDNGKWLISSLSGISFYLY